MKGDTKLSMIFLLLITSILPAFSQQGNQRPVSKAVQRVSNKWLGNEQPAVIRGSDAHKGPGKEVHMIGRRFNAQESANVVSAGNADWTISKRVNLVHRKK